MKKMQSSSELTYDPYDDFEVEIGLGKGREYPVAVLHSEAGEARETMHFPYDELVLENRLKDLKIVLLESGGMRRNSLSPEEQTVQNFGSDLFNALFTGEVRNRYDISMEKARLKRRGLRVKLRIQPPNLAVLPWEFLYEPRQAEYMGLMRSISIVRYPEHPQPILSLNVTLPLRILGMISSPIDLPKLDIDNEKQRVEEAIKKLQENGFVELTWLEGQTWRDLHKAMRGGPWHIFHFIGHGEFDRRVDEGVIALADEEGRMHRFDATQLSMLLADHDSLRLVILNSCEGARGSERDLTSSTASILVRRGIPAVLAMQYKITDMGAIEFSRAFYEALADGLPVDAAVAEARKAVRIAVANTVEWGTPVLYMRSPNGVLFSIQKKAKSKKPAEEGSTAHEEEERLEEKKRDIGLKEKEAKEAQFQAQKEADRLEQERREQEARQAELSVLYSKGIEALAAQNWQTTIEKFKEVLAIDAGYKDASARLKEAEQQLELAKKNERQQLEDQKKAKALQDKLKGLYNKGKRAVNSKDWEIAIIAFQEVVALDSQYQDSANLLAVAEAELKKIEETKRQEKRLAELYARAVKANKANNWTLVISTCQEIHTIDPDYKDAAILLDAAKTNLLQQEEAEKEKTVKEAKLRALKNFYDEGKFSDMQHEKLLKLLRADLGELTGNDRKIVTRLNNLLAGSISIATFLEDFEIIEPELFRIQKKEKIMEEGRRKSTKRESARTGIKKEEPRIKQEEKGTPYRKLLIVASVTCVLLLGYWLIYGNQKPIMSISSDTIDFGTINTGETVSRFLSISNTGDGTLTWSVSADQPWITVNPTSGTNSDTVTININTAGLSPGSYSGTITVTSNGVTKTGTTNFETSNIYLKIAPTQSVTKPILSVSPDRTSFNFVTMDGGISGYKEISISNAGDGTLTWSVSADQPWITVKPTSGANNGTVWLRVETPGLSPGSYAGTITITSNNIPKTADIYLTVAPILNVKPSLKKLEVMDVFNDDIDAAVIAGLGFEGKRFFENGNYSFVNWQGDKFVALYGKTDRLANLTLEQRNILNPDGSEYPEKKTLSVGETWEMGDGWALTVNSIDVKSKPRTVWFNLSKDGVKKDDYVAGQGGIYTYTEKSIAGYSDVPLFVTYVDAIFRGATTDMVQLKYTWVISPE